MDRDAALEEDLNKTLFSLLNGSERNAEKIIWAVVTDLHPTLQQAWWRVMKQIIYQYAEIDPHWVDARNQASVEFCKRLADSTAKFVSLPTI